MTGGLTDKGKVQASVEIFDVINEKWQECPAMNEARHCHTAIEFEGQIYVFGGRGSFDHNLYLNTGER